MSIASTRPRPQPTDHDLFEYSIDEIWRAPWTQPSETRVSVGRSTLSGKALRARSESAIDLETTAPARLTEDVISSLAPLLEQLVSISVRSVARRITTHDTHDHRSSTVIVSMKDGARFVTTIEELPSALEAAPFESRSGATEDHPESFHLLFRGGTAAVLLHELVGHPLLAGKANPPLPPWITVSDDPSIPGLGSMERDDCGLAATPALLSRGETPRCLRRASFRDVPMPRMTNIVVTGTMSFDPPRPRIEIHLIDHGSWDADSDRVRLMVTRAYRISASGAEPLSPFVVNGRREQLASAIAGARGPVENYPGVICSEEGQRLPVGSHAVEVLLGPTGNR